MSEISREQVLELIVGHIDGGYEDTLDRHTDAYVQGRGTMITFRPTSEDSESRPQTFRVEVIELVEDTSGG